MQGSKKPPTSEVQETSKSDRRGEQTPRPAGSMRRDDRAEPDDQPSNSRIDVVNVDGDRGESASSGLVSLRRELAKLHQQAAAVERSLEDQRRDRSDSIDRLERATERGAQLEARLATADAEVTSLRRMHEASLEELTTMRAERDDLELAVQAAKSSVSELGRLRIELD
jgi:chromosome segregation ATPase